MMNDELWLLGSSYHLGYQYKPGYNWGKVHLQLEWTNPPTNLEWTTK